MANDQAAKKPKFEDTGSTAVDNTSEKVVSIPASKSGGKEEFLRALRAQKAQAIDSKSAVNARTIKGDSPLKLNLVQAENLKLAQAKITDLERQLEELHAEYEKLASGSRHLKEMKDKLQAENEDLKKEQEIDKADFLDEKQTLMSIANDSKKEINRLKMEKEDMQKKLNQNFDNIRFREHSLESQIGILKSEHTLLKKEKDKIIINLESQVKKLKYNLETSQSKIQDLQNQLNRFKENSRKIVSVLRNTMNNLDGFKLQIEESTNIQASEEDEE